MTAASQSKALPALRADVELLKGAPSASGEPSWLLHDPLQNRFLKIDQPTYETLRHWSACRTPDDLIARVNAAGQLQLDEQSLAHLVAFLHAHYITAEAPSHGWRYFAHEQDRSRQSVPDWLLHNYLFFRVPLFRPQNFLEGTLPVARLLSSRATQLALACLGAIGLYLVSGEWDAFLIAAQQSLTWEGMLLAGLALLIVKGAHELGHAYTTVAQGCRVHTMGVAFVVMAPLLYTDVTDAWRLRDRRQRLAIDSAGIKVELGIAAVALFLWAFLPDGAGRSIAFTLSVVSVLSSLAINLNPFMRFDGYFLLSEILGVDNLQQRAFELGRWKLREWLFGLGVEPPEYFPRARMALLVAYAWAVWIYRLVLFTGIALLVYYFFFKVLGIILFAVEMLVFIIGPIMHEVRHWFRERRSVQLNRRTLLTALATAVALGFCIVPWSTRVEIPSIVERGQLQPIHSGRAARIAEVGVKHGARVKAGDVLARLEAPELEQEIELTHTRLALAKLQHSRRAADAEDRAGSMVIESSVASLVTRLDGLERELAELVLRAPFDGVVVELNDELSPGRWIGPKDLVATVAGDGELIARGYVTESDLWRIAPGSRGTFVPEIPQRRSLAVQVEVIAATSTAEIDIADLASVYSGGIAVMPDETKRLVPTSAQYLVRMSAASIAEPFELSLRGVVLADGKAESLLARVWRQVLKVLVRESGA